MRHPARARLREPRRSNDTASTRPAPPSLRRSIRLGYGIADFGASLSYTAINTWLLFFLVNVAELSPLRAGMAFVTGRVVDAALDPIMGAWLDRARGRVRRTALVGWGAIPLGVSFMLLWAVPPDRFWLALAALLAFSVLYTLVQVPYMALTPDLAPDYDARTDLTGWRVAFGIAGSLVAAAAPPVLVALVDPAPSLAATGAGGWIVMGLTFGALTAVPYLVMARVVPEPAVSRFWEAARGARSLTVEGSSFRDRVGPGRSGARLREVLGLYGFREILVAFLAATLGLMIVSSMLPFWLESAIGVSAGGQALVLALFFGVAAAAFPLWSRLSRWIGKPLALVIAAASLAALTVALALGAPAGGLSAFLLAGASLAGVALAGVMLLPWAMLPDVVEFGEIAGLGRRDGTVYALFTFGQKLAGSVGVFANAIAASAFGYRPGVAEQSAATVAGIELMVGPAAGLAFVAAAVFAWRVPITRESHAEARRALDARGSTVEL